MKASIGLIVLTIVCLHFAMAQPKPGDVFREYVWLPDMVKSETGKFLRVGGRLDYQTNRKHMPARYHKEGFLAFGHYVDLEGAIRAEVVLEKIGSHEDTRGLRLSINRHEAHPVPAARGIPVPEADYMHHNYPVVQVPLKELTAGRSNAFRLDVDSTQRWNWPQNLIYGVILRIYYQPDLVRVKTGLSGLTAGDRLGEHVDLAIENPNLSIRQVDYLAWYDGVNYEGDGLYQQWHYHFFRGRLAHHIGTAFEYPYDLTWTTTWVPDQKDEIKIAARVVDNTGLIYFAPAVEGLSLHRNFRVELGKPYDQPKNWVTRQSAFSSKINLEGDPAKAEAARLIWTSWSPCYANGVFVNGQEILNREGPCYEYMAHDVPIKNLSILRKGVNIIGTGKEPLHDGQMVHGMEVQWPGIMMLVKYQ